MTRELATNLQKEINQAIQEVFKKYHVQGEVTRASYSYSEAKFQILVADATKEEESFDEIEFAKNAFWVGLRKDAFDAEFTVANKTFRLKKVITSRPKYPIVAEEVKSGKRFKFATTVIDTTELKNYKIK